MPDPRTRAIEPDLAGNSKEVRTRVAASLKGSVERMMTEKRPLASLGDMDDIEMMEAATDLTRKR